MTDEDLDRYYRHPDSDYRDDFDPEEDHEFPRWAIGLGVVACIALVALAGWMML